MGIKFRVAEFAGNTFFEFFRDEVLQPFGLIVQFIDRVIQHAEKKGLNQSMVTDDFKSPLSPSLG